MRGIRFFVLVLGVALASATALARDLSFEERVKAQEAIERIYYSHQIGATKPFEQAVPRGVIEGKVRTYLEQTNALRRFWGIEITNAMLDKEVDRIRHGSRLSGRLR